jgi:hypothetical protein
MTIRLIITITRFSEFTISARHYHDALHVVRLATKYAVNTGIAMDGFQLANETRLLWKASKYKNQVPVGQNPYTRVLTALI